MPITLEFKLPYKIKKGEKYYISSCPVLDVYSQGETVDKAKDNLIEAISLFILSCYERGTLDEVLKECGFVPGQETPPQTEQQDDYINVPIPFSIIRNSSLGWHA